MAERKPISKSKRFEVFKRDSFTCQYCGQYAPNVLLEIDHIIPIAEGGDNNIMNLVTACKACNSGKGKRKLSDTAVIKAQKKQLDEINEKRQQLEMISKWRNELAEFEMKQVCDIETLFFDVSGYKLSSIGKNKIKMLIKRFGFDEVLISTEIAINKYFKENDDDGYYFSKTLGKIGGVCYNRKNGIGVDK